MLLAVDGIGFFVLLALWLFCIFDAITAEASLVRNLPKGFWVVLVLILPDIGSIMWLIAGRPRAASRPGGLPHKGNTGLPSRTPPRHPGAGSRRGPVAPDDDPDFLAQLDRNTLSAWEDDLRRREQKLREHDDPDASAPGSGA